MEVLIVHHHLNPGGVTRVIESQVQCLREFMPDIKIKILTGHIPAGFKPSLADVPVVLVDGLNYIKTSSITSDWLTAQYNTLYKAVFQHITVDSMVHIHNPNLGKNPVVTYLAHQLAVEGVPIFNHAHDFAEDRPNNLELMQQTLPVLSGKTAKEIMYPTHSNYHFGVLNTFDFERLQQNNIGPKRLHLVPNPVSVNNKQPLPSKTEAKAALLKHLQLDDDKWIITYPVRAIERKNIGEFILLAALFHEKAHWLITQPPKNPVEVPLYQNWKSFALKNNIPVIFEAGNKAPFDTILRGSDLCFTTSYREGFGLAYLEPWLFGTPVKGRNIPYATSDIIKRNIQFPYLYDNVLVNGTDFPALSLDEQQQVVEQLCAEQYHRDLFLKQNNHLISIFERVNSEMIEHNAQTLENAFSLKAYANELVGIYQQITE